MATTVAALQLVEKKLIALDSDVSQLLPALGRQQILVGWHADGSPILRKRRNPITLRQLLTHCSGCGYDFLNRDLVRLRRFQGTTAATRKATVEEWFDQPLLFEPGESWEYGSGVDWVGKLVEQFSGMSLEDYIKRHIWAPLGLSSFTFWPKAPGYTHKLATVTELDPATKKLQVCNEGLDLNRNVTECFGGHGGYCTAADFAELLFSLLADDERVLQRSSVELMFQSQLPKKSQECLQRTMKNKNYTVGDFYDGEVYNWGLGGLLIEETRGSKAPYTRGPGTLVWSSRLNHFWFVDRSNGLLGVFMSHVVPAPDLKIRPLIRAFQENTYRENKNRQGFSSCAENIPQQQLELVEIREHSIQG
ncbi:hypothetical protein E4U43_008402 [Claviceps pusilla]|uniref:Beta-lactamase-related domain-containing protein n=1 Tax=Claviceps pusilla TaxID=123648 RepID=A0A9P7ND61_9HYPO|nr:hypothetical protein E4U43_008402 [Claviceps pusilla]